MNLKKTWAATAVALALVWSALAVAAPKPAAKPAKPAAPNTCVYKLKIKSSYGNEGLREMYIKGSNFRWDYHSGDKATGTKMELSRVRNKDGAFLISKMTNLVGKYPPGDDRGTPMSCFYGPQGDVKAFIKQRGAKKQKAEKVGKKRCDVYAYTVSKSKYKLYVEPKTITPVQLTETAPMPKGKTLHRTTTYLSYKRGVNVKDSLFMLPKDIPVRPMKPNRPLTNGKPQ